MTDLQYAVDAARVLVELTREDVSDLNHAVRKAKERVQWMAQWMAHCTDDTPRGWHVA